ncbi:hypothetical protein BC830DRAFT_1157225 [Chytriomyces sp. MP71]|nr:hypothetical protein BC830DRAFT_1157225 [Chytriomyces sp. MP71]
MVRLPQPVEARMGEGKKRASTSDGAHRSQKSAAVNQLVSWLAANKVHFDKNSLEIECTTDNGNHHPAFSVVSRCSLKKDSVVGAIAKTACLTARNCGIADVIESECLTGTLALSVALLFERTTWQTTGISPWDGYLQALPPHAPTPLFWTQEQLAWLEPTDVPFREYAINLKDDFDNIVIPLLQRYPALFPPRDDYWTLFKECTSLVTSRAFAIDAFHGDALVPLADLFNHLSGGEHVHIEGEGDVCVFCGAVEDGCDCLWSDDEEDHDDSHSHSHGGQAAKKEPTPTEDELKSLSVKQLKSWMTDRGVDASKCLDKTDLVDTLLASFTSTDDEDWEDDADDDDAPQDKSWLLDMEEPIPDLISAPSGKSKKSAQVKKPIRRPIPAAEDSDSDEEVEDALDITIVRPVPARSQVYNVYGDHPNEALLNLYGFAEIRNPNNGVLVPVAGLVDELAARVGVEALVARGEFWRKVGRRVLGRVLAPEDDEERDSEWDDDSSDEEDDGEHVHGPGCHHGHAKTRGSKKEQEATMESVVRHLEKDSKAFHFDTDGEAGPALRVFLALALLDEKVFDGIDKDVEAAQRWISGVVKSGAGGGAARKGKKNSAAPTRGPLVMKVSEVLRLLAARRLERYAGTDWEGEEKEMKDMINKKVFNERRWAMFVRTEERRILDAAMTIYKV